MLLKGLFFIVLIVELQGKKVNIKELFDKSNPKTEQVFKSLGLDKKDTITKEEFKTFFIKLVYKGYDNENRKQFNEGVITKFLIGMPDEFEKSQFEVFMDFQKFVIAIQETVKVQFGPQYVPQVTKAIIEMGIDFDDDEDDQATNSTSTSKDKAEETAKEPEKPKEEEKPVEKTDL